MKPLLQPKWMPLHTGILVGLVFWAGGLAVGQSTCDNIPGTPDSVFLENERLATPALRIEHLFCCASAWQYDKPDAALRLYQIADQFARQAENKNWLAKSKFLQARLRYFELDASHLDMAKTDAEISADLYRQLSNPEGSANALAILAAIAFGQGNLAEVTTSLSATEKMLGQLDSTRRAACWASAQIHALRAALAYDDPAKMRSELETAVEKFRALHDEGGIARAYKNLALVCQAASEPEAIVAGYFHRANDHFERCGSVSGSVSVLVRAGAYYTDLYRQNPGREDYFLSAVRYLKQAEAMQPGFEVLTQLGIAYHQKASALSVLGQPLTPYRDSVFFYYEKALGVVVETENEAQLDTLVNNIAAICASTGDCSGWVLRVSEARKVLAQNNREQLLEARNQMASFAEEQGQLRRRNQWITAAMLLVALAAVFAFAFFQLRVRSLNRELQAQLKMLQARLNPHFIANCMNAIDSLIGQQRLREASGYIVKFTRLCRNLLDQSDDTTVSIAKEMETLGYYLDLEKLRLGDKLNYALHTDPAIAANATRIPLMLVQPFVENAIWHGIQPKGEPGTVRVAIEPMPGNRIRLTVEDDGIGREQSKQLQSQSNREHRSWGMDIARQRIEAIRQMRGAAYDLEDLKTDSGLPAGTRVTILLPVLTA
ncbi:MAG: histidine kinase [Saprospiraceae bacterium]